MVVNQQGHVPANINYQRLPAPGSVPGCGGTVLTSRGGGSSLPLGGQGCRTAADLARLTGPGGRSALLSVCDASLVGLTPFIARPFPYGSAGFVCTQIRLRPPLHCVHHRRGALVRWGSLPTIDYTLIIPIKGYTNGHMVHQVTKIWDENGEKFHVNRRFAKSDQYSQELQSPCEPGHRRVLRRAEAPCAVFS